MKNVFIIVCAVFLIAGCQNQIIEDNRKRAEEVMAIHDEAMAKMTYMHELKLQLQDLEKTASKKKQYSEAVGMLQNAHQGMMAWMREYKPPKSDVELESAEKYLVDEKLKIKKVSNDIADSISRAESLIRQ